MIKEKNCSGCIDGYIFLKSTKLCEKCKDEFCVKCNSSEENSCIQCLDTKIEYYGICVNICKNEKND